MNYASELLYVLLLLSSAENITSPNYSTPATLERGVRRHSNLSAKNSSTLLEDRGDGRQYVRRSTNMKLVSVTGPATKSCDKVSWNARNQPRKGRHQYGSWDWSN